MPTSFREQARQIWQAGVDAVMPATLMKQALHELRPILEQAERILVVGTGKAGSAMASAVETELTDLLAKITGWVNVPAGSERKLQAIHLHPARPTGSNHPSEAGVVGAEEILRMLQGAGPNDVAICLLSGGGSALLPAPAMGLSLADKQEVTRLLHACGATITEMNTVRKHLSAIKGGRLAEAFRGRALYSLIISDVVGDPLDVIASGPTTPDPTTYTDSLAVLARYDMLARVPSAVLRHLEHGQLGQVPETPKSDFAHVQHLLLGNNARALAASEVEAKKLGFHVLNLGAFIEGESAQVGIVIAGIVRSIQSASLPIATPACILLGGETTVALGPDAGKGGRNQEFVLACLLHLGECDGVTILSGGTDGEDGPTDAAGAIADRSTLQRAKVLGLNAKSALAQHNAYPFFDATGDLLRSGLTQTNVTDVRVILVH